MPEPNTRLVVVHAGFGQPVRVVLYRGAEMLGQVQLTADQATAAAADLLEAVLAVTCVRGGEHNG
jgi:hypothetical protein